MTISSIDTKDNPLVSPNWLLTTHDQELAVQGFKRAREIAAALDIIIGSEFDPGSSTQSDAQILEYLKQTVGPFFHASATCRSWSTKFQVTCKVVLGTESSKLTHPFQVQWVKWKIKTPSSIRMGRFSGFIDYVLWMHLFSHSSFRVTHKPVFVSLNIAQALFHALLKFHKTIQLADILLASTDMLAEKLAQDIKNDK